MRKVLDFTTGRSALTEGGPSNARLVVFERGDGSFDLHMAGLGGISRGALLLSLDDLVILAATINAAVVSMREAREVGQNE